MPKFHSNIVTSNPQDTQIKTVHSLELFFDLVFVFTISQVTKLIAHPHGVLDYIQAGMAFWSITWMYVGFVWLTSNVNLAGKELERWNLLLGMFCFFGMAVGVSHLAAGHGMLLAISLLLAITLHFFSFWRTPNSSHFAITKIAPYNFATGLLILLAVNLSSPWCWVLWGIAILFHFIPMFLGKVETFPFSFSPSHFVERHGLVVIIALGEGVIALGVGASEQALSLEVSGFCIAGLLLMATFWWTYFGLNQHDAEKVLFNTSAKKRIGLANSFSSAHTFILAGCILLAGSFEVGIIRPLQSGELAMVGNLSTGVCLFLLSLQWLRKQLGIPLHIHLWFGAGASLMTIPLGWYMNGLCQITALIIIMLWVGFSKLPDGKRRI